MNGKRWTALIIAGVLLLFSLGINTIFAILNRISLVILIAWCRETI